MPTTTLPTGTWVLSPTRTTVTVTAKNFLVRRVPAVLAVTTGRAVVGESLDDSRIEFSLAADSFSSDRGPHPSGAPGPDDRFIISYGDEVGQGVVLEPMFKALMQPTADEVRRWADSGSLWPEQDWDLCIWSDDALLDTFVELATDDRTQKHEFFLSLRYGRVGDAVRSGMDSKRTADLIEELGDSDHQPLRRFAQRAKALLARPELFDYDDWCRGGLTKDEADWPPAGLPPQPAAEPSGCRVANGIQRPMTVTSGRERFRASPDAAVGRWSPQDDARCRGGGGFVQGPLRHFLVAG